MFIFKIITCIPSKRMSFSETHVLLEKACVSQEHIFFSPIRIYLNKTCSFQRYMFYLKYISLWKLHFLKTFLSNEISSVQKYHSRLKFITLINFILEQYFYLEWVINRMFRSGTTFLLKVIFLNRRDFILE